MIGPWPVPWRKAARALRKAGLTQVHLRLDRKAPRRRSGPTLERARESCGAREPQFPGDNLYWLPFHADIPDRQLASLGIQQLLKTRALIAQAPEERLSAETQLPRNLLCSRIASGQQRHYFILDTLGETIVCRRAWRDPSCQFFEEVAKRVCSTATVTVLFHQAQRTLPAACRAEGLIVTRRACPFPHPLNATGDQIPDTQDQVS